jgi:hypothetical protein
MLVGRPTGSGYLAGEMERVPEVRREFWMNHEQTLLNSESPFRA